MKKPIAYFLCEVQSEPSKYEIIKESVGSKGRVSVQTTLQEAEVFNRNGRRYYKKYLKPALEEAHIMELQKANAWFGECAHPMSDSAPVTMERMLTILPDRAAIRIDKHWWDGNLVKGIVTAAQSPMGDIFQRMVVEGDLISSYSLRAMGPVVDSKDSYRTGKDVLGPMRVINYDWVILPSHANAYADRIITPAEMQTGKASGAGIVTESASMIITEADALAFITNQSNNVKFVSEIFDVCFENMVFNADRTMVTLKENSTKGQSVAIRIEDALSYEINKYFKKM